MEYLREKLTNNNLKVRIIFTVILFLIMFTGIMIASYYLLPEGLLKNINPMQSWDTSGNNFILTLKIFFYNMLSVLVIIIGSLFGQKKERETNYFSLGYLAFFTFICVNGMVLGTWSFSVQSEPVPLLDRVIRTFDLIHRAGLWEMMGQLLITCSTAHIAIIRTSGKNTTKRKIRDIRLVKLEKITLMIGFVLMLIGAVVESIAINMR